MEGIEWCGMYKPAILQKFLIIRGFKKQKSPRDSLELSVGHVGLEPTTSRL